MRNLGVVALGAVLILAATHGALAASGVTVASDGSGGVNIDGDSRGNKLTITDEDGNSDWTITGSGGTLVNGVASVQTGILTGQMSIVLNDGDDSLKMSDGTLGGRLYVHSGSGDDKVSIADVTVTGFVHVEGGDGDDKIKVQNVVANDVGNAFYSSFDTDEFGGGGTGSDQLKLKGFTDQNIYITLAAGADKAQVQDVTESQFLTLTAGSETDKVTVKSVDTPELDLQTGAGDFDSLKVQSCSATIFTFDDSAGTGDVIKTAKNTLGTGSTLGFGD